MSCIFLNIVSDIFYKWQKYKKDLTSRKQYALLLSGFNVWRSEAIWLQLQRSWPPARHGLTVFCDDNYGLLLLPFYSYGLPLCTGETPGIFVVFRWPVSFYTLNFSVHCIMTAKFRIPGGFSLYSTGVFSFKYLWTFLFSFSLFFLSQLTSLRFETGT